MARPTIVAAAMTLAVVALLFPAAAPPTQAASSVRLEATYDTVLKLAWASRAVYVDSRATVKNTSGAAIDRIEFNTIATRLGGIRLHPTRVDGATVAATISDQTISVPLGKSLANGASTMVQIRYSATLRSSLSGSNWLFTKANGIMDLYRWLPWVSRRIAFTRPNHGDPFMTPSSPLVKVRIVSDRKLVFATTGDRIASTADGLSQTFQARNVRDFTVTAATDYRTGSRVVDGTTVRVWYRPGSPGAAMLDAAADAFPPAQGTPRRVSIPRLQGRGVRWRLRHGVAGPHLDPARRRPRQPALPRRPRDGSPVVLRAGRERPVDPAVRR